MSGAVEYVQRKCEERGLKLRPWNEFADTNRLGMVGVQEGYRRVQHNAVHFSLNYAALFVVFAVYCVLTNPLFLFGLAVICAAWASAMTRTEPVTFRGQPLSEQDKFAALVVFTLIMLWMTSVGSILFWLIGASLSVCLVHAYLYKPSEEPVDFEAGFQQAMQSLQPSGGGQ